MPLSTIAARPRDVARPQTPHRRSLVTIADVVMIAIALFGLIALVVAAVMLAGDVVAFIHRGLTTTPVVVHYPVDPARGATNVCDPSEIRSHLDGC